MLDIKPDRRLFIHVRHQFLDCTDVPGSVIDPVDKDDGRCGRWVIDQAVMQVIAQPCGRRNQAKPRLRGDQAQSALNLSHFMDLGGTDGLVIGHAQDMVGKARARLFGVNDEFLAIELPQADGRAHAPSLATTSPRSV